MVWWEAVLLFVGGGVAGIVNAMAGGGSSLTVPLLVLAGVPGNFANGTNRVGIFVSNGTTIWSFHRQGVKAYKEALPFFLPVVIGSLIGSIAISQVTDRTFETIFGILKQIIKPRLIHSLILKHLQILIYQIRDLNQSNFFCLT